MADGYARSTGRVGVCMVVPGPGVLNAGAFLVEFLTHGRPAVLSAVTDLPVRRPFPLGGASADLYVHASLVPGRPLVLVHGFSPEGKDDPRLQDVYSRYSTER